MNSKGFFWQSFVAGREEPFIVLELRAGICHFVPQVVFFK